MAFQADERPVPITPTSRTGCFAADEGFVLEGLFVSGEPGCPEGAIIAPPHPLYGGSMESPVVTELAHVFARAGLASLRFNWRGVGASAGNPSGSLEDAEEDVGAAFAQLAETVPGALVAAGYSFGAAAAARLALHEPRVVACLLVAPPPSLLDPDALAAWSGRVLIVVGERDAIASPGLLEPIADRLREGRCVRLPEADHFFRAGLVELGRSVTEWLKTVLPPGRAPDAAR